MMQNMIKRLLVLSVVCVFLSLAAVAQVGERRSELAFGFNAGVALNKITFEPTIKQRYHVGPTMGLTLRYTCEKYFKTVCALQCVRASAKDMKDLFPAEFSHFFPMLHLRVKSRLYPTSEV